MKTEKRLLVPIFCTLILCTTLVFVGASARAGDFVGWHSQTFTSDGTFDASFDDTFNDTLLEAVTSVDVLLVGGGGGGGCYQGLGGGGGGGGGVVWLTNVPAKEAFERHHRCGRCRGVRLRSWR